MSELFTAEMAGWAAVISIAIALLSFVFALTLCISLWKTKKAFKRLTAGYNEANIEQLLIQMQETLKQVTDEQHEQNKLLSVMREKLKMMKSKVAVKRYNAFTQEGSDMSFTIAILDEEANGVLLTGIHSREQTYVYAKPVERGASTYTMSPEEKETLTQTLRQSSP